MMLCMAVMVGAVSLLLPALPLVEARHGYGYYRRGSYDAPSSAGGCVAPTEYVTSGTYEDTDAFWESLDDVITSTQFGSPLGYGCQKYSNDFPYLVVVYYVRNDHYLTNPDYLRDIVLQYCFYHSEDPAVDTAYECSSGCPLVDLLNQVCQGGIPVPTTTEPPTTEPPTTEPPTTEPPTTEPPTTEPATTDVPCVETSNPDLACGDVIIVNTTQPTSASFFFETCGYPRDTDPCVITLQRSDDPAFAGSPVILQFTMFDVPCDSDSVDLYEGTQTFDNSIARSRCNSNVALNQDYVSNEPTLIIAFDFDVPPSGRGFVISYRVG